MTPALCFRRTRLRFRFLPNLEYHSMGRRLRSGRRVAWFTFGWLCYAMELHPWGLDP